MDGGVVQDDDRALAWEGSDVRQLRASKRRGLVSALSALAAAPRAAGVAVAYVAHHGRLECFEEARPVEGALGSYIPIHKALDIEAAQSRVAPAAADHAGRMHRRLATHRPSEIPVDGSRILGRLVEEEELLGRERGHDVRLELESSPLVPFTGVPTQALT